MIDVGYTAHMPRFVHKNRVMPHREYNRTACVRCGCMVGGSYNRLGAGSWRCADCKGRPSPLQAVRRLPERFDGVDLVALTDA